MVGIGSLLLEDCAGRLESLAVVPMTSIVPDILRLGGGAALLPRSPTGVLLESAEKVDYKHHIKDYCQ